MRTGVVFILVALCVSTVQADDAQPRATGILEGNPVQFPPKGVPEGLKATLKLLESCHDESLYQSEELKQAMGKDHVHVTLNRAITTTVMNEKIEFSEIVFSLPTNTGVFWLRCGKTWRRFTKFEFQKEKAFSEWLREAEPKK